MEKKVKFNFFLTNRQRDQLQILANRTGEKVAVHLRRAIEAYLKTKGK